MSDRLFARSNAPEPLIEKPLGTWLEAGTSTLISKRPLSTAAVRSADSFRNWGVAAACTTVASSLLPLPHAVMPSTASADATGMATKVRNGLRDTKSSLRACDRKHTARGKPVAP